MSRPTHIILQSFLFIRLNFTLLLNLSVKRFFYMFTHYSCTFLWVATIAIALRFVLVLLHDKMWVNFSYYLSVSVCYCSQPLWHLFNLCKCKWLPLHFYNIGETFCQYWDVMMNIHMRGPIWFRGVWICMYSFFVTLMNMYLQVSLS